LTRSAYVPDEGYSNSLTRSAYVPDEGYSNSLTRSAYVPDEGYYTNEPCALIYISTLFSLLFFDLVVVST
jgi:hypothetical protein